MLESLPSDSLPELDSSPELEPLSEPELPSLLITGPPPFFFAGGNFPRICLGLTVLAILRGTFRPFLTIFIESSVLLDEEESEGRLPSPFSSDRFVLLLADRWVGLLGLLAGLLGLLTDAGGFLLAAEAAAAAVTVELPIAREFFLAGGAESSSSSSSLESLLLGGLFTFLLDGATLGLGLSSDAAGTGFLLCAFPELVCCCVCVWDLAEEFVDGFSSGVALLESVSELLPVSELVDPLVDELPDSELLLPDSKAIFVAQNVFFNICTQKCLFSCIVLIRVTRGGCQAERHGNRPELSVYNMLEMCN